MLRCKDCHTQFLSSITRFVNLLLRGSCPKIVAPILFGGNLTAITKGTNNVRPITVGYYWRRLAAKCANFSALKKLSDYFLPFQVGVGSKGGCEAAVHACRRFMTAMPDNHVLAKLDFSNAFNSIRRDAMLNAVAQHIPEILPFCYSAYACSPMLKFGDRILDSNEGIQQGDPLGPLLFCLTIQPILQSLSSQLVIGYMDDVTVGGDLNNVTQDIDKLKVESIKLGLMLNEKKCEIITRHNDMFDDSTQLSRFLRIPLDHASLLGAPLSKGPAMDAALEKKFSELHKATNRLTILPAHDALTILKSSCSTSKLLYILRTSPCNGHSMLSKIDELNRSTLTKIVNVNFNDRQWSQATLPVRNGGLGLRNTMDLAFPAFLSSVCSSDTIQSHLLHRCTPEPPDEDFVSSRSDWILAHGNSSVPDVANIHRQSAWDAPGVAEIYSKLLSSTEHETDKARLLAAASPHSGDWIHALPISACGLRLDDDAIRTAVAFRVGAKVCYPHSCPCGSGVDSFGLHALSCKNNPGKIHRHNYINDIIYNSLSRAGMPCSKEPLGLSRSDGKRPDGVTQVPWQGGKPAIWDVTVADTLAPSYVKQASILAGAAAEIAETRKETKYRELSTANVFVPIALETLGPIGRKALVFLTEIGRRSSLINDDTRETSFLFQRISVAVQRFNSLLLKGSFTQICE